MVSSRPLAPSNSRSRCGSSAETTSGPCRSAATRLLPGRPDAMLAALPRPDTEPLDTIDDEALDAYSVAVSTAAERLIPSVASLRVTRQMGGWTGSGAGSAVAIEPVGYLVTSAHVVAGSDTGTATFVDGAELDFEVVGRDALSDL